MSLSQFRNPLIVGVLFLAAGAAAQDARPGVELHIAPNGSDTNSGTEAAPFASLERARNAIRELKKAQGLPTGGVAVMLHGGLYELPVTFELTAEDSGMEAAPIVFQSRKGEEVRLSAGRRVIDWKPVTDAAVLDRLDPAARDHIRCADLRAQGVRDFGKFGGGFGLSGGPGLELFFNDRPMTLSRFPNEGFITITGVNGPTEKDIRGTKGCVEAEFTYDSDRPARWKDEKDGWVLGYWFWDWAEQRQPIESIDPAAKRMTLAKPYHGYGYRKGQWFHGFNLLCEIDRPGEWYLDREAGLLYFWPPAPIEQGQATVSVLENVFNLKGAKHITFRGLTLEAARGAIVAMADADGNRIVGCTLRNAGGRAVTLHGVNSGVVGCDIYGTGDGGITLIGGDRKTLTPARLHAENNHIHHWSRWNRMYRQGIFLHGVGNRAAHNRLHDSPHIAIGFSGNDHVIELNEIHDVCTEANDAGAIYAGRDLTMRGTEIRYNHLHHIRGFREQGCVGVYLDDMFCGTRIHGNLFHDVTRAAFIGGGHDNAITNNIFVDCKPAVHVDARGLGWAHMFPEGWLKEIREQGTLSGIQFKQPPYSTRYPRLPGIADYNPAAPTGTLIARNVCWGGKWAEIESKAQPFVKLEGNLLEGDPLFVDAARGNFQLRDDSPAYKLGFERIPLDQIGLINDGTRTR